jgi:2-amino-4-hydroxy-6-hydroxymethyldihydropteridine diphosphokinase
VTRARVFVSVGSNIDKESNIRSAVAALRAKFGQLVISRVYESAAVGFDGRSFHNLVIGFDTDCAPVEVAQILRGIEYQHGRTRHEERFASRTLDLDLLLYGDLISDKGGLQLPRDEITRYAFVLRPLADVAGDLLHPQLGVPIQELWNTLRFNGQRLQTVDVQFESC